MTSLRLGIDIDGVLADFNAGYQQWTIDITGRDLFPERPYAPPTWFYLEPLGYTADEDKGIWKAIEQSTSFWERLPAYESARKDLEVLADLARFHQIYFITTRMGIDVKGQTERWLIRQGYWLTPTVLISSDKGSIARGLKLDGFVDDRPKNCYDVQPYCPVSLKTASWNLDDTELPRVSDVDEFLRQFHAS